ncbi:SLBB domain-containing protein, partial [bacterium]|nr:SLBB domain-containing protein [bacterium]
TDLQDEKGVTVTGEVRKPGTLLFRNNYTLKDALLESGGFTDAATVYRIEIARRLADPAATGVSDKVAEVINIDIDRNLDLKGAQFTLQPFDLVTVRRNPGYVAQQQVSIEGEVMYPGNYTIRSKKDRISDLLNRSGGFSATAYQEAVSLIRRSKPSKMQQEEKAKIIADDIADSVDYRRVEELLNPVVKIAINIAEILRNPDSDENLYLEEGDVLEVPKKDLLVKISGEVYSPTKTTFESGRSLHYYLNRAGGITEKGRKQNIYVVYANGQIAKTEKYLFGLIKKYPRINTGADIVVPAKAIKNKASTGEIIGIAGVLVSMAGVAISVMNTLRR